MNIIPPNKDSIEVNLAGEGDIFLYVAPIYDENQKLDLELTRAICRFANVVQVDGKFYPQRKDDEQEFHNCIETDPQGFVYFVSDETNYLSLDKSHLPYCYYDICQWTGFLRYVAQRDRGFTDTFFAAFWTFSRDLCKNSASFAWHYDLFPGLWFEQQGEAKTQLHELGLQALIRLATEKAGQVPEINLAGKPKKGVVYFLQNKDNLNVKIGNSTEEGLASRIASLQTANSSELILLATIQSPNAPVQERSFHKLFREYHIRGEWFEFGEELQHFLKILAMK